MSTMNPTELHETVLDNAMEAVKEASADAAEAAAKAPAEIGKFLSKTVYGGFYYLSYGVVFGSLIVGKLIPKNSAMAHGIHDGAIAARDAFKVKEAALREAVKAPEFAEGQPAAA
jgi:putative methionine-R-sulfoxide reductase with GAF domain